MNIVITGGAGGLGAAIATAMDGEDHTVTVWDIVAHVDVADYANCCVAASKLSTLDALINCAGMNYIDWFEDIDPDNFELVMRINAQGILHTTQALLPQLMASNGTVCNIISNAAHIPMSASLAYNASKAAAAMMTRQMAHELGPRHGITVFGIAPNKLADTGMAAYTADRVAKVRGWTPEETQRRQLAALPVGRETPVAVVADFIAYLLSAKERHRYLHGCILPYGGPT